VAGKQAGGVTDQFGSRREGRISPEGFSAAGKRRWQARVGVTDGVRAVGEDVLDGAVLGVGSRPLEEDWSRLSTVARFGPRGTMVVEWRSSRGRRQVGHGSSRRRCRARGSDGEFGGGPRQRLVVAQ
jgi:hypothetical protein